MSHPIHVLIATAGRPDLIGRTLESLAACQKPDGYTGTVVVENGPQMGTEEVVRALDPALHLRYIHNAPANKSAALNRGLESIKGGLVIFFDDDIRLDEDVLVAYARAAGASRRHAYFGGRCKVDYEEIPPPHILKSLPISASGLDPCTSKAGFYMGFNWAAFADDIKRVGGFSTRFGPGSASGATGQETEMQSRLQKAGKHPIPISDAVVWHYVPRDRCSEEWVVRRGFKEGLAHAHLPWESQPLGGVVRSVLSLGINGMRFAKAIVEKDQVLRLESRTKISFRAGFIRGLLDR